MTPFVNSFAVTYHINSADQYIRLLAIDNSLCKDFAQPGFKPFSQTLSNTYSRIMYTLYTRRRDKNVPKLNAHR